MCLFRAPLFLSLVCVRACGCGEDNQVLLSFVMARISSCSQTLPPPLFFLRFFRLGGVASCVLDFPLSDSSHGCPFSSDVVSARNVTGTAQEIHAGGETSNFVTPLQVCE